MKKCPIFKNSQIHLYEIKIKYFTNPRILYVSTQTQTQLFSVSNEALVRNKFTLHKTAQSLKHFIKSGSGVTPNHHHHSEVYS